VSRKRFAASPCRGEAVVAATAHVEASAGQVEHCGRRVSLRLNDISLVAGSRARYRPQSSLVNGSNIAPGSAPDTGDRRGALMRATAQGRPVVVALPEEE
jgi:hypothetical protein